MLTKLISQISLTKILKATLDETEVNVVEVNLSNILTKISKVDYDERGLNIGQVNLFNLLLKVLYGKFRRKIRSRRVNESL